MKTQKWQVAVPGTGAFKELTLEGTLNKLAEGGWSVHSIFPPHGHYNYYVIVAEQRVAA